MRIGRKFPVNDLQGNSHTPPAMPSCKLKTIASWFLQLIAAGILAQTLFFKFSGAPESRYIFTTLGVEPWGRIAAGLTELVAVVLLLVPRTLTLGALLALGVMTGAIGSHLTRLGIEVQNDGGLLFALAVLVLACSFGILLLRRHQIPVIGAFLSPQPDGGCTTEGCRH